MKWWLALVVLSTGCRALHEERVSERLLGRQLMSHDFVTTMTQLDTLMQTAKSSDPGQDCELCVLGSQALPDKKFVYCVQSGINTGCVLAQEVVPGRVRLLAIERGLSTVLAHALDLTTTAEGVETDDQLKFLRANGCDHTQGYFFSKPLSATKFADLLKDGKAFS